jgi:arabinose-5-phosphate isomerase
LPHKFYKDLKNISILSIARQTILEEARTLERLVESLDSSFEEVVQLLYQAKGRIIFTGVGKSALIAQKIVATLNSTGTPSIYMHAGDAAHGDLGMVTREDVLVCLSKSGQTSELQVIIPLVKLQGTVVVGICAEESSFLAEESDMCIFMPIDQEAAPNNLIPTSSTTAQLAIGDAIAVCLLSLRGFSTKQFAHFHPGGSIGKQLFVKVSDMYPKNARPLISEDATIRDTILEMTGKRLGAVVVSEDGDVKGIITDGDLRRMLQKGEDVSHLSAADIMTINPICIGPKALAYEAFSIMKDKSISHMIVSENGKYLGILHIHDFIREGFL